MRRLQGIGFVCSSFGVVLAALLLGTWISGPSVAAHTDHRVSVDRPGKRRAVGACPGTWTPSVGKEGRRLFEEETFGGMAAPA